MAEQKKEEKPSSTTTAAPATTAPLKPEWDQATKIVVYTAGVLAGLLLVLGLIIFLFKGSSDHVPTINGMPTRSQVDIRDYYAKPTTIVTTNVTNNYYNGGAAPAQEQVDDSSEEEVELPQAQPAAASGICVLDIKPLNGEFTGYPSSANFQGWNGQAWSEDPAVLKTVESEEVGGRVMVVRKLLNVPMDWMHFANFKCKDFINTFTVKMDLNRLPYEPMQASTYFTFVVTDSQGNTTPLRIGNVTETGETVGVQVGDETEVRKLFRITLKAVNTVTENGVIMDHEM